MTETYFADKVAVITGGGGTLCSQIARDLASQGAKVVIVGRSISKLEPVMENIRANGGFCVCKAADVSDEASMQAIGEEILQELGPCSILVNGAGGNNPRAVTTTTRFDPAELDAPADSEIRGFFNITMDNFRSVIDINVVGTIIACRVFAAQMARSGGGEILNFASMNSYRPLNSRPAYALSKAGIVNFTQWLANYLAPAGIRVNAVAPGFVANANNVRFNGSAETGYTERGQRIIDMTPSGRFGIATDVSKAALWLLNSEAAGFVTGVTVPVDGGFLTYAGL